MSAGRGTGFDPGSLNDFESDSLDDEFLIKPRARTNPKPAPAPKADADQRANEGAVIPKASTGPRKALAKKQPAKAPKPRPAAKKAAAAPTAASDGAFATKSTTVYMTSELQTRIRETIKRNGGTNATVLIDGMVWCHENHDLREIVAETGYTGGGELFAPRPYRARTGDRASLNALFYEGDYPVIDRLCAEAGGVSRSKLLGCCADRYFKDNPEL